MTKALNENALDVAILLTEGGVKDIATGGTHKIVAVNCVPVSQLSVPVSLLSMSKPNPVGVLLTHSFDRSCTRRCMFKVRCVGEYTQERRKRTSNLCLTSMARSFQT